MGRLSGVLAALAALLAAHGRLGLQAVATTSPGQGSSAWPPPQGSTAFGTSRAPPGSTKAPSSRDMTVTSSGTIKILSVTTGGGNTRVSVSARVPTAAAASTSVPGMAAVAAAGGGAKAPAGSTVGPAPATPLPHKAGNTAANSSTIRLPAGSHPLDTSWKLSSAAAADAAKRKAVTFNRRKCDREMVQVPGEGCQPCTQPETAYYGNNILSHPLERIQSTEDCREKCKHEPRCNFFTYDLLGEWCYLKYDRNSSQPNRSPAEKAQSYRYTSGTKFCNTEDENEIPDYLEQQERSSSARQLTAKQLPAAAQLTKTKKSSPVLSLHQPDSGHQTVFTGLPANFGLNITAMTKVSGRAIFAQPLELCSLTGGYPRDQIWWEKRRHGTANNLTTHLDKIFGIVRRGLCSFSIKTEIAANAGFDGLIILDNQDNTTAQIIEGNQEEKLKNFPIIFLLKKDADIFLSIVKQNPNIRMTFQDSSSIMRWHDINATSATATTAAANRTTSATRTPTTQQQTALSVTSSTGEKVNPGLLGRQPPQQQQHLELQALLQQPPQQQQHLELQALLQTFTKHLPATNSSKANSTAGSTTAAPQLNSTAARSSSPQLPPSAAETVPGNTTTGERLLEPVTNTGILHLTPLTLTSIIVGVILGVLLVISVTTIIVGRMNKRKRRRQNHTRCQQAIRQMEQEGNNGGGDGGGRDNEGYEGGAGALGAEHFLPKSAKYLLECPVCLDLAWPPKKIFQCREGHIVCETCKGNPNLRNCPMCRVPLTITHMSRNRQLEELAIALLHHIDPSTDFPGEPRPSAPPPANTPPLTDNVLDSVFMADTESILTFEENIEVYLDPTRLTVHLPPETSANTPD